MKVNMKEVMTKAVQLARKMEGDWVARMKLALRIVWNNIKKGVKKAMEFIGSEKQVKWAKDVYQKSIDNVQKVLDEMSDWANAKGGRKTVFPTYKGFLNQMKEEKDASFWIDHFGYAKDYQDFIRGFNRYVEANKQDLSQAYKNYLNVLSDGAIGHAMKLFEKDILDK